MINTNQSSLQVTFIILDDLNYREKAVIAGASGYIAAFISNPFELIMTR
jgi:hypothetical protein